MSPAEVVRRELSRSRRDDAKLAAMILLAAPERLGTKPIYEFLKLVKCTEDTDLVTRWLRAAKIDPLRPGRDLTRDERGALARQLTSFWKAGQS